MRAKNVGRPWNCSSHSCAPQINGIGSENAQTSSVSVNPKYDTRSSNTNTIVGYTYSHQLTVNVKNLTSDLLSEVLDTAVASGGNQLQIQQVSVSACITAVRGAWVCNDLQCTFKAQPRKVMHANACDRCVCQQWQCCFPCSGLRKDAFWRSLRRSL